MNNNSGKIRQKFQKLKFIIRERIKFICLILPRLLFILAVLSDKIKKFQNSKNKTLYHRNSENTMLPEISS